MMNNRRFAVWNSSRFWLLVVALVALPLLIAFNARLALSRQVAAQEDALQQQINTEQARHEALLALQTYIQSNDYVEHWARLARLAKPGEVAVIPVAGQSAATSSTTTSSPHSPNDSLGEWWAAFFGDTR
jgi:cell division protein FtsB